MQKIITLLSLVFVLTWCAINENNQPNNNIQENNNSNIKEDNKKTLSYDLEFIWSEFKTWINILNQDGETLLSYDIDKFNQYLKENWDKFKEKPMVANREINPWSFQFFDPNAIINNNILFFTVHDYASATSESIFAYMDIKTEDINFIKQTIRWTINHIMADKENNFVAFVQDTARSQGDFLTIIDLKQNNIIKMLGEDDIISKFENFEKPYFMPNFKNLTWEGEKLLFETENPTWTWNISWSIDNNWNNLTIR